MAAQTPLNRNSPAEKPPVASDRKPTLIGPSTPLISAAVKNSPPANPMLLASTPRVFATTSTRTVINDVRAIP